MKIRKITSLTAFLSFMLLTLTSLMLYVSPQGRVAYWSDWHLLGLDKSQWGNIHMNVGLLFLISIALHIWYNWKPIVSYLKDKAKNLKIFTREFNVALILSFIVALGTFLEAPPFVWVIDINSALKDAAAEKYGEPPYGHAELSSLKIFSSKMGLELSGVMERLKAAGVKFENEKQTIQDIAKSNRLTPQQLYGKMRPDGKARGGTPSLPENPRPGLGKRSLTDICGEYGLDVAAVLGILSGENVRADAEMSIKDIAAQNNMSPIDVYHIIRENAESAVRN